VCEANREIGRLGLAPLTWGNASAADRSSGIFAIKPSGISYEDLSPDEIVVISLQDGVILAGHRAPSSDAETHRILYQAFQSVAGIVHTHSRAATSWAQAGREIPCLGTTHADHFNGPVPVTRSFAPEELGTGYVANTGRLIVETIADPQQMPAVLVRQHGPFVWGDTLAQALENAIALEQVAQMALDTLALNPNAQPIAQELLERHFLRKHGRTATYGQKPG
jgi:L-ribulose-5-phosphate 4-epimerase